MNIFEGKCQLWDGPGGPISVLHDTYYRCIIPAECHRNPNAHPPFPDSVPQRQTLIR